MAMVGLGGGDKTSARISSLHDFNSLFWSLEPQAVQDPSVSAILPAIEPTQPCAPFAATPTISTIRTRTCAHACIVQGDAFSSKYLERALAETRAEIVVLSIGQCDSVKKSYIRTASAQALAQVLKVLQNKRVRIVMVSSSTRNLASLFAEVSVCSFHFASGTFLPTRRARNTRFTLCATTLLSSVPHPSRKMRRPESLCTFNTGNSQLAVEPSWVAAEPSQSLVA
jgi:hypothetical protein